MPNKPDAPEVERIPARSPDIQAELREQLRALIPEAFAEGKLDTEKLKALLGENGDIGLERYSFSWAGKRDALAMLQLPTRATLVPDREHSVNFDEAQHVFIEGENLEVLKVLYRSYFGRVKMIYIDPPYNTGNDFIYPDDFADPLDHYLRITGQKNGDGDYTTSQVDKNGRIHSAWLSMMYPRLVLARQFLSDSGVIFVSCDDNEHNNLKNLMNEIFGEENFIATIIWQKVYAPKNSAKYFSDDHDYILAFARNLEGWLPQLLPRSEKAIARYSNPDGDKRGDWKPSDLTARNPYSKGLYEVRSPSGRSFKPSMGNYWRVAKPKFEAMDADKRVWWGKDGNAMPQQKRFLSQVRKGVIPQTMWFYKDVGHTQDAKRELTAAVKYERTENVLDTVKPTGLIRRMLQIATVPDEGDIVLDFFAGSNATSHAVLQQNREDDGNRQVIAVQFPEKLPLLEIDRVTLADVARERMRFALNEANGNGVAGNGFRAFNLATSTMRAWSGVEEKDSDIVGAQIEVFADSLISGWKPESVIWEVALREGYSLTSRIEKVPETGKQTFWRVTDPDREQSFVVCLDDALTLEAVRALKLPKDALFICRDTALDDTLSANLALQCRLKVL